MRISIWTPYPTIWHARFRFPQQAIAQAGGSLRTGKQALEQGTKIKAGAASDDGQLVAGGNSCDGGARSARVVPSGVEGIRRNDIEQVMRHLLPLLSRGLSGSDFQTLVDRHGIATDDLSVEVLRQGNGEGGFATPGRAQNDNQQWALGFYQTLHQPGGKRLCAEERPKPTSKRRTATTNRP